MLLFCDNLLTNSSKGFQFLNNIGLKLSFGSLLVGNLAYIFVSLIFLEKLQKDILLHFLVFKFRGIELTFFSKTYGFGSTSPVLSSIKPSRKVISSFFAFMTVSFQLYACFDLDRQCHCQHRGLVRNDQ